MTIAPIRFFAPAAQANAAAALAAATPTAAANVTAANGTTLTTFSAVLGQLLADLGPLAFDTTLTSLGGGTTNNTAGAGGLVSTVFNLFLFNSLGAGQTTTPAVQQLLITQALFGATGTTDETGLGAIGTQQLDAALAAQQQGANNPLLAQLANVSTQPNPILFSASGLAQAFSIGNDTGSPA